MKLVKRIKKELEKGTSSIINLRGEISGTTWMELNITEITGNPITLGTHFENLKFRAQKLVSGALFTQGNYRIDNSHDLRLHQHFLGSIYPVEVETLSGALLMIFGSDYRQLE